MNDGKYNYSSNIKYEIHKNKLKKCAGPIGRKFLNSLVEHKDFNKWSLNSSTVKIAFLSIDL